MSTKTVSPYSINTGDNGLGIDPLNAKSRKPGIDPATGTAVGDGSSESNATPGNIAARMKDAIKVADKPAPRPEDKPAVTTGTEKKLSAKDQQEGNYQSVRADAGKLSQLSSGAKPKADAQDPKLGPNSNNKADPAQAKDQPMVAQNQKGVQQPNNQVNAAMAAIMQNLPKAASSKDKQPLSEAPKNPQAAEAGNKADPKQAVQQPKGAESPNVQTQLTQAGAASVQAGSIKETKQQNAKKVDKDGDVNDDGSGEDSAVSSSPFMQGQQASRDLKQMSGGMNADVTAGGGGEIEISADGIDIDPERAVLEPEGSLLISTSDSDAVVVAKNMAARYKTDVEQAKKEKTSIDSIVKNWETEPFLDRLITETKEQMLAAQTLINALRGRGQNGPNGYGRLA